MSILTDSINQLYKDEETIKSFENQLKLTTEALADIVSMAINFPTELHKDHPDILAAQDVLDNFKAESLKKIISNLDYYLI